MTDFNAQQLRQNLISSRKNLPETTILDSAERLALHIEDYPCYKDAKAIAVYLAVNGEADPCNIVHRARADGKTVYLPVIQNGSLLFAPYSEESSLVRGQFNIPVPKHAESDLINPRALDVIIVPLVAFDSNLNRIGMGGGFYDKTFAFRQNNSDRPRLIGVAHDFQRVDIIHPQPWDIPMDGVITETNIYRKPEPTS